MFQDYSLTDLSVPPVYGSYEQLFQALLTAFCHPLSPDVCIVVAVAVVTVVYVGSYQ
jgi:hypothetical protein